MPRVGSEWVARLAATAGALALLVLYAVAWPTIGPYLSTWDAWIWCLPVVLTLVGGVASWLGWWPIAAASFAAVPPFLRVGVWRPQIPLLALALAVGLTVASVRLGLGERQRRDGSAAWASNDALSRVGVLLAAMVLVGTWHFLMFLVTGMSMASPSFELNILAATCALAVGGLVAGGAPWQWGTVGFVVAALLNVAMLASFPMLDLLWAVLVPLALAGVCWRRSRAFGVA